MTAPVTNSQSNSERIYENLAKAASSITSKAKLGFHDVKVMLSKQHELLKKYDAELYPMACIAAAITLLCTGPFMALACFTLGALFSVSKGDKWKEGLITPIKDVWKASTMGKIALAALFIFGVAPLKWNIAAFALGILAVQDLQKP